jgi:hypothetical protein
MNQSRKTLFFVFIAISCGLITFLLTKSYVTDLDIALALLTLISLIGAITLVVIKKLRWLRVSKFIYFLAIIMTTWFVSYFLYWKDSFISKSTAEYVSEKLEAYKLETGHYPKTNSSNDLVDSLTININEYLPETFSYYLDESGKFYVLKTYEGDKLYSVYDSRIKKEIISEIRRE